MYLVGRPDGGSEVVSSAIRRTGVVGRGKGPSRKRSSAEDGVREIKGRSVSIASASSASVGIERRPRGSRKNRRGQRRSTLR